MELANAVSYVGLPSAMELDSLRQLLQEIFRAETSSLASILLSRLRPELRDELDQSLRRHRCHGRETAGDGIASISEEGTRTNTISIQEQPVGAAVQCQQLRGQTPRRLSTLPLQTSCLAQATSHDKTLDHALSSPPPVRKSVSFNRFLNDQCMTADSGQTHRRISVTSCQSSQVHPLGSDGRETANTSAGRTAFQASRDSAEVQKNRLSSLRRRMSCRLNFFDDEELAEHCARARRSSCEIELPPMQKKSASNPFAGEQIDSVIPMGCPSKLNAPEDSHVIEQHTLYEEDPFSADPSSDGSSNTEKSTELPSLAINAGPCARGCVVFGKVMRSIVECAVFDYCVSSLIIVNAAAIGFQTDYMLRHISEEPPSQFRIVEATFCILFTVELAMRIYVYGHRFFFMQDWRWNLFDCLVVGVELMEELLAVIVNTRNAAMPAKLNVVRVIRLLRLVRIIRLVRLLRFIQELRTMVCSIVNSFRSLCWTVVLLMLMVYIVSVCLTQLIADHGSMHPEMFEQEWRFRRYYGSLARTVLSLFQSITGGMDWDDLAMPIANHISPLLAVVFLLYICFALFAMMNVITGVFVESALDAAKVDKENNLLTQLHRLFLKIDRDKSGVITWEEFASQLDEPHMESYFKSLEIDASEAYGLFTLLDVNNSGEINVEEFVLGFLRLRGGAQAIDLATLTYFNKRMYARIRADAQRVEALLEDVLESVNRGSHEGDHSRSCPSRIAVGPLPSLLTTPDNGSSDLATWAELKAKGEESAKKIIGRINSQPASPRRRLARSSTHNTLLCELSTHTDTQFGFAHQQTSRNEKRDDAEGCTSGEGNTMRKLPSTSSIVSAWGPSASCSMGSSLSLADVNEDGQLATWAELKAEGERRARERT